MSRPVSVRLTLEATRKIDRTAKRLGVTRSDVISAALNAFLDTVRSGVAESLKKGADHENHL